MGAKLAKVHSQKRLKREMPLLAESSHLLFNYSLVLVQLLCVEDEPEQFKREERNKRGKRLSGRYS